MTKRPNVIIFNPDQWRGDTLGHVGHPAVQTPVMDSLVQTDAISFEYSFAQATVCTPSRCSFMTGWYPHVRGHRTMHHMLNLQAGEPNLLKVLRENGYFVWWGGKNDLVPGQLGFEEHCDVYFRPTQQDFANWRVKPRSGSHGGDMSWRGDPEGDNFYSFFKGKLDTPPGEKHFDGDWAMVYGAREFLKSWNSDQPLCMFLPIGYPHPPYCVEEPWYSLTNRSDLPPRFLYSNWEDKPSLLAGIRDGQRMETWTEDRWSELRATYCGMCSRVDHQFGLLLDTLRAQNLYDDCAIFLFSDHGDFTGDYGLVEKTQNTFQDCLSRVPFIFKPPQKVPSIPGVRSQLVELVDLAATIYEIADIDCGYPHFGKSLTHLLMHPNEIHRDAVFCEGGRLRNEVQASERESIAGTDPSRVGLGLYSPRIQLQIAERSPFVHTKATMCRNTRFKYIRRAEELDELYDLHEDPGEVRNLINDAEYADELAEMKDRLLSWYMETCDVVPMDTDQRNFMLNI